jgi:hypothetical protein
MAPTNKGRLAACALASLFPLSLGAPPSFAADSEGYFVVISGWGTASCGKYLSDISFQGDYEAWIAGYLTAFNQKTPIISNILMGTDALGALAWIKNYCLQNPTDDVLTATEKFTDFMRGKQ